MSCKLCNPKWLIVWECMQVEDACCVWSCFLKVVAQENLSHRNEFNLTALNHKKIIHIHKWTSLRGPPIPCLFLGIK